MTSDQPPTGPEMPPHLVRYLEAISAPAGAAESPDPAATSGDGFSLTITPGYDVSQYLEDRQAPDPQVAQAQPAEGGQETGHVDPKAATRWHQAQNELAELIHAEARTMAANPDAPPVLPDELAPWLEQRVAALEQTEPEIG